MVTKNTAVCHCMLHHTVTSSNNQLQSVTIVIINRFQLVQASSLKMDVHDSYKYRCVVLPIENRFGHLVNFGCVCTLEFYITYYII